MSASALAQEKFWVDKPSYDKAERLFYESAAKLGTCCKKVSRKNVDQCLLNSNNCASTENSSLINSNNQTKSKPKKSKDNKALDNASNENAQNVKNQKKSSKSVEKREEPILEKEVLKTEPKGQEIISNVSSKKLKLKEAKEKKNKADKKSRSKEEGKSNFEESKEILVAQGNEESTCAVPTAGGSLANEVAKAQQHIKQSLQCMVGIEAMVKDPSTDDISSRMTFLEKENKELRNIVKDLKKYIEQVDKRVKDLEEGSKLSSSNISICPPKSAFVAVKKDEKDDDVDLFGSDSEGEDAEAAKIREERLAAYNAKKSKKAAIIAKSNIIMDVKPWDDETDMKAMETEVRKIVTDGLLWGAAKLVPLAYGIHKLQISCVVEDDKVSIDWLTEKIQEIEDYVQSVDIAAFNKV